jgi:hypothetical protein
MWHLPRQMPNAHRQSQRAKPASQHRSFSAMNLPALPESNSGGQNHHDAANSIHARILSAPRANRAATAAILSCREHYKNSAEIIKRLARSFTAQQPYDES